MTHALMPKVIAIMTHFYSLRLSRGNTCDIDHLGYIGLNTAKSNVFPIVFESHACQLHQCKIPQKLHYDAATSLLPL